MDSNRRDYSQVKWESSIIAVKWGRILEKDSCGWRWKVRIGMVDINYSKTEVVHDISKKGVRENVLSADEWLFPGARR